MDATVGARMRKPAPRRRGVGGIVGVVAFAGLVSGCAAQHGQGVTTDTLSPEAQVAVDCSAVIPAYLGGLHTIVFLEADASEQQIAEVRTAIDALPVVEAEFVDSNQAFEELKAQYPDAAMLDGATASDMSPNFRLELATPVDLRAELDDLDGVANVLTDGPPEACRDHPLVVEAAQRQIEALWGSTDLRVLLQPDAPGDALRAALRNDARVVGGSFVSKDAALVEFRCLFADKPELLDSVTLDVLPASIELDLAEGTDLEAIAAELVSDHAVREVVERPTGEALFGYAVLTTGAGGPTSGRCSAETEPL